MGSDPQSHLQLQYDLDRKEFLDALRKRFPIAIFAGSEKFDYGPKCISALCESVTQAESMIRAMWPTSGYWEVDWDARFLRL